MKSGTKMRAIVIYACLFLSLSACACEKVQAPEEGATKHQTSGLKRGHNRPVRKDVDLFGGERCFLFVFHHIVCCGSV